MAINLQCKSTKKILHEDWYLVNVHNDKTNEIGSWCREKFGQMLGEFNDWGRWFGSYYEISGVKHYYIAIKDESDYLLYTLKWA